MKRRSFFAALAVAPAAIVAAAQPKATGLVAIGVAGHDIPKGCVIYGNTGTNCKWELSEHHKPWGIIKP